MIQKIKGAVEEKLPPELRAVWGKLPSKNKENIIRTMEKYGENCWWLSKDLVEIAKYQIFEPILMVQFDKFHEGFEKLIGRPVWTHEFGIGVEGLREEARRAIRQRVAGTFREQSETERGEKFVKSLKTLIRKVGPEKVAVVHLRRKTG